MRILFDRRNYIVLATAVAIIILGFILMSGGNSPDGVSFNPEVFSIRRIVVAPVVCLIGFVLVFVGILLPPQKKISEAEAKKEKNL